MRKGRMMNYIDGKLEMKKHKIPKTFYVAVHPVLMAVTLMVEYLLLMAWVWPDGVGTRLYGDLTYVIEYLGTTYNQHMQIIFLTLVGFHVLCSITSIFLCCKLGIKKTRTVAWAVQTLIFGMGSLGYLISPENALLDIYGIE